MTILTKTRLGGAASILALCALGQGALAQGFALSLDGVTLAGDPALARKSADEDLRLQRNDVSVTFHGFDAKPVLGARVLARAGGEVEVRSEVNYPAFVTRGELRFYGAGGERLLGRADLAPNSAARLTVPQGEGVTYRYRVYDGQGRFDETPLAPVAQGAATQGREQRSIALRGGLVRVEVRNLQGAHEISALGGTALPDAQRRAVIERILPPGTHQVDVLARGYRLTRSLEVPASDWFATGVLDLTYAQRRGDLETYGTESHALYGRGQGFVQGRTAGGWEVRGSIDTQEDDLGNLLRNVIGQDPRARLGRIDPQSYYPTYGDDSTLEDTTPTSSGLYLRLAKEENHLLVGTFKSDLEASELLRNERALYGGQLVLRSASHTEAGAPRAALELYGAAPEHLPKRDLLRGTGGTAYFLSQRDVLVGSQTLHLERRDPDTGRLISRQPLVAGKDYSFNAAQGLVTLTQPLESLAGARTVLGTREGLYLAVSYEYAPVLGDLGGTSTGARGALWLGDHLRLGATARTEKTGAADQQAQGVDALLRFGAESHLTLEHARTEGPGFTQSRSLDAGLTLTEETALTGEGTAAFVSGVLVLDDLGLGAHSRLSFTFEDRSAGFATVDRRTPEAARMGQVALDTALSQRASLSLAQSQYEVEAAAQKTETTAALSYQVTEASTVTVAYGALERFDPSRPERSGAREELGLRLAHQARETLSLYGFATGTMAHEGGLSQNNRLGAGGAWAFIPGWSLAGEASQGTTGEAVEARLGYEREGRSVYGGYRLETEENRTVDAAGGQVVLGAREALSESLTLLNETSYTRALLTSSYGAEYRQSAHLTHDLRYTLAQVTEKDAADLERHALSLGTRYGTQSGLAITGRLELRRDFQDQNEANSILVNTALRHDFDQSRRLTVKVEALRGTTLAQEKTEYTNLQLGYALRPIRHDVWSLLARYQYFHDLSGQTTFGATETQPLQLSHIGSVEGSYRLAPRWSWGAKLGLRFGERQNSDGDWSDNRAWLGVTNLRYHLPKDWDLLGEVRYLSLQSADLDQSGVLVAAYKHLGAHVSLGAGYNFSSFSDDLTDQTLNNQGAFLNFVMRY